MAGKDILLALRTAAVFRKGKEAAAVVNFLREGVGSTLGLRPNMHTAKATKGSEGSEEA